MKQSLKFGRKLLDDFIKDLKSTQPKKIYRNKKIHKIIYGNSSSINGLMDL